MTQSDVATRLFELLDSQRIPHLRLHHAPTRTSDESRLVRKKASGLDVIGAKALVQKLTHRDKSASFALFVLPGDRRFDSNAALAHLSDIKRLRFLSSEEVHQATSLEIGAIPPFGRPLLPAIASVYFDSSLLEYDLVGFNAALHECSVIMKPADLVLAAHPGDIFPFSAKQAVTIFDEIFEGRNYCGYRPA
jgi:Ala-tRNA(Pro) deacylase